MKKKASAVLIGCFVVVGICLVALVAILVAVGGKEEDHPQADSRVKEVRAEDLPKEGCLQEFYKKFAVVKNGDDGCPKWYGCPRNFHRLTMSWYLNDPKTGEKPSVTCDESYEFWSSRDIKQGEELTVDSSTYSDHAKPKPGPSRSPRKKNPK